jgi:taurine dioxygenase
MPAPPAHAILAAQVLPEAGGDTRFANQYLAYETLSDGMKRILQDLRAWHGGAKLAAYSGIENTAPPQSHPIVRTHPETGRKGLYVNRLYTYCIDGLTEAESRGFWNFCSSRAAGRILLIDISGRRAMPWCGTTAARYIMRFTTTTRRPE